MTRTPDRKIRKAQTISPFGVGAIFDFKDESFIGIDVGRWPANARRIESPRLSQRVGTELAEAPAAGLPYLRFPRWLVCRKCTRMTEWHGSADGQAEEKAVPRCAHAGCNGTLIPIRFVMACKEGHLSDVPWQRWVHLDNAVPSGPDQANCDSRDLEFKARQGGGGSLASLYVKCRTCGRERSLERLMSPAGLKGIRCRGGQPWYARENRMECNETPEVVQRGATNLYSPIVESALDIPPESNYDPASAMAADIREHQIFTAIPPLLGTHGAHHPLVVQLAETVAEALVPTQIPDRPAAVVRMRNLVILVASDEGGSAPRIVADPEENLLLGEWQALTTRSDRNPHPLDRFQTEHTTLLERNVAAPPGGALEELDRLVDQVVLVRRLREVRALKAFTRLDGTTPVTVGRPGVGRVPRYMPAIEVYGEGVFITLKEDVLLAWIKANEGSILSRVGLLRQRMGSSTLNADVPAVTARFLVVHTLAHLLIRQFAFEAGYSASSLRERLYIAEPGPTGQGAMAGLLIYTAAGDRGGTLGGLVRLGEPGRLSGTFLNALAAGQWCSSDPVCGESTGQGMLGLNLAACHACTLVSETSCVHRNMLLDRTLLLGNATLTGGFFSEVLRRGMKEFMAVEEG